MTDRITATLAVIEAAKEWYNAEMDPHPVTWSLLAAIQALASATSPDLDAKIAEVLPCICIVLRNPNARHMPGCPRHFIPAVRDLIVTLLATARPDWDAEYVEIAKAAEKSGYEQAREQTAKIAEQWAGGDAGLAARIRAMEPSK